MFRLTSASVALTHRSRRARQVAASATAVGATAFALLICGQAFAQPPGTSSRMTQEQHACSVVMGLHSPGDLYDTCIRSLDKTLSELDQARVVAADRSACAQRGLRSGTPGFADCVVEAEQSSPAPGHYAAITPRQ